MSKPGYGNKHSLNKNGTEAGIASAGMLLSLRDCRSFALFAKGCRFGESLGRRSGARRLKSLRSLYKRAQIAIR